MGSSNKVALVFGLAAALLLEIVLLHARSSVKERQFLAAANDAVEQCRLQIDRHFQPPREEFKCVVLAPGQSRAVD